MGIEIDPHETAQELCERSRAALLELSGECKADELAGRMSSLFSGPAAGQGTGQPRPGAT